MFVPKPNLINSTIGFVVQVWLPMDELVERMALAEPGSPELTHLIENDLDLDILAKDAADFEIFEATVDCRQVMGLKTLDVWGAFNIPVEIQIRAYGPKTFQQVQPLLEAKATFQGESTPHQPTILGPFAPAVPF